MAPLTRIMTQIIRDVVIFLVKLEASSTSVMREITASVKRIIVKGSTKARRSRCGKVSSFLLESLFSPYFARIASTRSCGSPAGVVGMARKISSAPQPAYLFMRESENILFGKGVPPFYKIAVTRPVNNNQ